MTTGERMKARRKELGYSAEYVASKLGISPSTIYRYEKGDIEKIAGDMLVPIADVLRTTPAYLMGWAEKKVSEIKPLPEPEITRDIDPIYDALNPAGQQALCAYGRFLGSQTEYRAKEAPKKPVVITRIIPLLGQSFAAGSPEAPGDLFMQDYSTTDPHAEFAIKVNGDSMEPYLPDGSIALGVKRAPIDGEVGAWWLDGGFLVKQVAQDNYGNTYLFSLNRDRSDADETIMHDSGRDLRCVGTILMDRRLPLP